MKKQLAYRRQRGLSLVSWVILLAIVTIFGSAGVKLVPAYTEFNTLSGIIDSALKDSKTALQSEAEFISGVSRRFDINGVDAISARDLIVTKESGRLKVTVDYEVRKNLFGNLDLVVVFHRDFSKDGPQ